MVNQLTTMTTKKNGVKNENTVQAEHFFSFYKKKKIQTARECPRVKSMDDEKLKQV